MFFPKKFTFLQYWVQLKHRSGESTLTQQNKNQSRGLYPLVNARVSQDSHANMISTMRFKPFRSSSICYANPISTASLNRKSAFIKQFPLPDLNEAKASSQTSINSNNSFTTSVVLGELFSQPKPWYNYWILPFVGFISILPTLTSCRNSNASLMVNNSNYGFKYLNMRKAQFGISKSMGFQTDHEISGFGQTVSLVQPVTPVYSLPSTKDLGVFPRNLRNFNSLNHFAFSKPVFSKSQLISLPEDRVGTAIQQLAHTNKKDSRTRISHTSFHGVQPLASARVSKEPLTLTTEPEKIGPSFNNTIHNSRKLNNLLSFALTTLPVQDVSPYMASQHESPASSYKTVAILFDSMAKQLLYSKDFSFQKAFLTKASSSNISSVCNTSEIAGTSTLLQLLQKSPFNNSSQLKENGFQSFDTTVNFQPYSRFLPSYQDAFYFYTYLTKTSNLLQVQQDFLPEKLNFLTKQNEFIFRIKTPSFRSSSICYANPFTRLKADDHRQILETNFNEGAVTNEIRLEDSQKILENESSSRALQNSILVKSSNISYVQSLNRQRLESSKSHEIAINRPILVSTDDSEMLKNNTTSVQIVDSSKDNFQKYFSYIQSRLLQTLQAFNYYQDKQLNIQPHLVVNTKKLAKFSETQLELVKFKPVFSRIPEADNLTLKIGRFPIQTSKFHVFKYKRKSLISKEKFFRNFSLNASIQTAKRGSSETRALAKGGVYDYSIENRGSPDARLIRRGEKLFSHSQTKQFQNLLRKAYSTQEVIHKNQKAMPLGNRQLFHLKVSNLNSKMTQKTQQRNNMSVSSISMANAHTQTQYNLQPIDLLRIKHFVFLSNKEKRQYKHYPTLDVILKDEKLLYETLVRQNQKQKRRKKKRKRWTRRRRKRKRKLLRPIWTTIQLVKMLNARRLSNSPVVDARVSKDSKSTFFSAPVKRSLTYSMPQTASSNNHLLSTTSQIYSTKHFYRLSKKSLVELTNNKFWKTKVKTLLKNFETVQVAKTKNWLKTELLNRVIGDPSVIREFVSGRVGFQKVSKLSSNLETSILLEYNRIMYERLQTFFINYGSNIDKNSHRQQQARLPALASSSSYSKINNFHTKIVQNAPKEEWVWLFKYITGELPSHPITSSKDQLRSIWAISKLQSTNQWTGWKNFYYQEFKKGLTPTYELWQDKKPDKRYNVNNLKKRQYKQMKYLQRLRLAPQLHRGTYFALERDLAKLTILGSPYKKLENSLTEKTLVNRPIDKLRLTLQTLQSQSRNTFVSEFQTSNSYLTYQEQKKKATSTSSFITTTKKPILDLYATWWNNADSTGWGWKTIQYGAPWDRKTLYIPSKLTSEDSIKYSSILNESSTLNSKNNWFGTSSLGTGSSFYPEVTLTSDFSSFSLVLLATLVFHICAFLGLVSLAEVRYSTKVNLILAYKLSAIPLKLINTVIQPFAYAQKTKVTENSSETSLGRNSQSLQFNQDRTSPVSQSTREFSKLAASTSIYASQATQPTQYAFPINITNSLSIYKYGFYGSLKQLIKKVLRQKTNQSHKNNMETSPGIFVNQTLGGRSPISLSDLTKLEQQKFVLKTILNSTKLRKVGVQFSYSTYYGAITIVENLIDYFRDTTRSVYDFFSLPENFSPNPDEVGLDVLANFIYDFEEPLIELLPDIIETQTEKYFDRYLVTLNLLGPAGLFVHQRWKWFYRMFVGLMYQADADYRKDEEEFHCLYTIWAEILNKAAEDLDLEATVIASQEDQRILLLEHLLVSNLLEQTKSYSRNSTQGQIDFRDILLGLNQGVEYGSLDTRRGTTNPISSGEFFRSRQYKNAIQRLNSIQSKQKPVQSLIQTLMNQMELSARKARTLNEFDTTSFPLANARVSNEPLRVSKDTTYQVSKSNFANSQFVSTWSADQYVLYKTDETDLFIEINVPKSFASIPSIKHWDTLHQPLGLATCHIYSGLLTKQMAKNILLIADNTAEKTKILQALAGETEVKLIMDNSSRYASISQSVAVGMRLLRDVFDAVALQTPCIFVLEDIHLIGEKRPFLISDEDLALVTASGLGLEQHQLYEKIQKIQQHSKHRISYFKKAYRGDAADSLPTNLLCYDLFLTDQPRTEWISPNYPIPIDFHTDLNEAQQGDFSSDTRKEKIIHGIRPLSHLLLSETQLSNDSTNSKISHFVKESILSTKFDENQQKQTTSLSVRSKVSSIADGALANISVKLDRITQLLVIMDNVRKNKGFIVFGTTNKPQILDPALRRPGRLEETIYLPSIPNILTKWETLTSQIKVSSGVPMKYSRSPITLDLFSIYNSMQKIPMIKQKNLLFTLANSITTHTSSALVSNTASHRFNWSKSTKIVEKQTSIIKMQFIKQLLLESSHYSYESSLRSASSEYSLRSSAPLAGARVSKDPKKVKPLVLYERQNMKLENLRRKKFLSEIVRTSYEQTAKSLLEILTRQTSTNILLVKSGGLQKQVGHLEDTIYTKLYSDKEVFKNDLIFVFAGIIANYFAAVGNTQTQSKTSFCNPIDSKDTTKDPNWQIATTLLYSYIQKRALYNKNTYIQKLFNRNYGSISGFPGPPITSLLLPAKRYENYLRAERDYEQTSVSQRTLSLQNKIQFHLNQRVLKRLYRLPIKEFYKSEIIENSLTTFSSSNFVLPNNTRNFAQQNMQSKTNFYYRTIFLNRHRHYLTTQWWTGHLPEYNIENTVMSEIDFRSYFVDKTKVTGFTGDLILDFPDADQHYNLKHRRWYLQSTSWKSWYDLEKGLTTDIMNHYIVEFYTQTYRLLDNNRELLDHYVTKLVANYQLHEIELISDLKQFTSS